MAMSAVVALVSSSSFTPPVTQNMATVLEFSCLYTPDLRRKQKRWQDGRLKFHTFNKRIMVYDNGGNFVGDSHWCEAYDFGEGEELELERCGNLVQVSECVGRREQDMTQLLDKRINEREERIWARTRASSPLRLSRHDTQNTSVDVSPSELTQETSTKRRRLDICPPSKNGYAQALTGAILTLSDTPLRSQPFRCHPLWPKKTKQPVECVDLTDPPDVRLISTCKKAASMLTKSEPKRIKERLRTPRHEDKSIGNIFDKALAVETTLESPLTKELSSTRWNRKRNINIRPVARRILEMHEDGFQDINVYDSTCSAASHALELPARIAHIVQTDKATRLRVSEPAKAMSIVSENAQQEPVNPLRIKPRPKPKLLVAAQARPALLPRIVCGEVIADATIFLSPSRTVSQKPPAERPNDITRTLLVDEHRTSMLENDEINYHKIDEILTRDSSGQNVVAGMKENNSRNHKSHSSPINEKRSEDLDTFININAIEGPIGENSSRNVSELGIIKQNQTHQQPKLLRGNNGIDIRQQLINNIGDSNAKPSRLIHGEGEGGGLLSKGQGYFLKPNKEIEVVQQDSDQDQTQNQQPGVAAWRDLEQTISPPHLVMQAQLSHDGKEYGAWSREAFDLFDWRPEKPSSTSRGLVVG